MGVKQGKPHTQLQASDRKETMLGRLLVLSLVTPAMVAGYDDRWDEAQHTTRMLLKKGGACLQRDARIDTDSRPTKIREMSIAQRVRCSHDLCW